MENNILSFGKRTAVITGGTKNIGLAIADKFLKTGMQLAIVSSNIENINKAKKYFSNSESSISFWCCDVSDIKSLQQLAADINKKHGAIDILVNCAGVLEITTIEDMTEKEWDTTLDINLKGSFFMVQACLRYLKKGNNPRIINISSNSGRMGGYANGMAYTASKGGMIAMTYGLARKLAPYGITVNCVAPGTIDSEMNRIRDEATQKQLIEKFPIGRLGTLDEVATATCYFASQESGFTTGAVLDVNGGMFMG